LYLLLYTRKVGLKHFHSAAHYKLQNDKFCCFWSDLVEHTAESAVDRVWPVADTGSVLCTVKDCAIPHSLWNTSVTVLPGRFADKTVRWQIISLTRWQDRNSVDNCIHLASCPWTVLS